jgi:hypothetical protein
MSVRWIVLVTNWVMLAHAQEPTRGSPFLATDDDREAIAIHVTSSGEGCPSSATFFQSVLYRAPGVRLARRGEPARVFAADWRQEGATFTGRLRVIDGGGDALVREVSGRSCAEVTDALALIASIAIQSPPAQENMDQAAGGEAEVIVRRPKDVARPAQSPPPLSVPSATDWHLSLRGVASVHGQILPVPMYGASVGPEIVVEGSSWQPAFGLTVGGTLTATSSTDSVVPGSEMSGRLLSAQFFASPVRMRWDWLELRPYAAIAIGQLSVHGQGSGLARGGDSQELWISATIFGQVTARFANRWFFGVSAGAEAHPLQYTFMFDPLDVYRVGAVGFAGSTSISFRVD